MKTIKVIIVAGMFCLTLLSFTQFSQGSKEVPYPYGYRKWMHIKTAIVGPKSPAFESTGGFHHIYANDKAVEGYKSNHFTNGAILVFDVLEAIDKDSDVLEGKRVWIGVMVKDDALYADTGGWGFEKFREDSKTERDTKDKAKQQCFSCHAIKKDNDFVFSKVRD